MSYSNALIDALAMTSQTQNPHLQIEKIEYGRGMIVGIAAALCWVGYDPADAIQTVAKNLPDNFISSCWPRCWNDPVPQRS